MNTLTKLPNYPEGTPAEQHVMQRLQGIGYNYPSGIDKFRTLFRVSDLLLSNLNESIPYRFISIVYTGGIILERTSEDRSIKLKIVVKPVGEDTPSKTLLRPLEYSNIEPLIIAKSTLRRICTDSGVKFIEVLKDFEETDKVNYLFWIGPSNDYCGYIHLQFNKKYYQKAIDKYTL